MVVVELFYLILQGVAEASVIPDLLTTLLFVLMQNYQVLVTTMVGSVVDK